MYKKTLTVFLLSALTFVSTAAFADFILGNASKYDLRFSCGDYKFDVPAASNKLAVIPSSKAQKTYAIAFGYYAPSSAETSKPIFSGTIDGNMKCTRTYTKFCKGNVTLKQKNFADFIEVYSQDQDGNVHVVFDDLPEVKTK